MHQTLHCRFALNSFHSRIAVAARVTHQAMRFPTIVPERCKLAQIGDWGLCSALCGGGLQQRTVQCRDAVDYRRAPDANCDTEKPEIIRACNQV